MTEEKTQRRKRAELPDDLKEGLLLLHLINKDHRKLGEISALLGLEQTYLSKKKLHEVRTLSSKVATAATRLWGLSPDYFERNIRNAEIEKKEKGLQDSLDEINQKLDLILAQIKNPGGK